jgi:hypothetical protein
MVGASKHLLVVERRARGLDGRSFALVPRAGGSGTPDPPYGQVMPPERSLSFAIS